MCTPSPAPWRPLKVTYNCLQKCPSREIPSAWTDMDFQSCFPSLGPFWMGWRMGGGGNANCALGDGFFLSLIFLLELYFLEPDSSTLSNEKKPAKSAPGIKYLSWKQKPGPRMGLGLHPLWRGDHLCLACVSGRKLVSSQAKQCW